MKHRYQLPCRPKKFFITLILLAALLIAGCTTLKQCAYEGFNRDEWQFPQKVIQSLEIRSGDQVADLGSGSGYFTLRLADAAGPTGKVYAVDVDQGLNEALASRARQQGYGNIEVILARYDDPLLPKESVDMIFTSNTYHHIENRSSYFANVKQTLKPEGRIAIIDFNRKGWLFGLAGHYTPSEQIKEEMTKAGYVLERELDFLPRQSFLIFSKSRS